MPMTEDIAAFLSPADFATRGRYDGALDVDVILDREFLEQQGVAGTQPAALARASVIPETAVGRSLVVDGTNYVIRGREPIDDGALVVLRLRLA